MNEVQNQSQEKVKEHNESKKTSIMKGLFKMFTKEFTLDGDNCIPTSNDSYLNTKYGHAFSKKERLNNFMIEIMDTLKDSQQKNHYACIKDVPYDLIEYAAPIVETFKTKGYTANLLCKNTGFDVSGCYIFISWDTYSIVDEHIDNNSNSANENKENENN